MRKGLIVLTGGCRGGGVRTAGDGGCYAEELNVSGFYRAKGGCRTFTD